MFSCLKNYFIPNTGEVDNDTYILMGGRSVKKTNPHQTLNALKLYEENKRLKQILNKILQITIKCRGNDNSAYLAGIIGSISIAASDVLYKGKKY